MSRVALEFSTKKELYRRFRKLSERNAMRVLGCIDALEEECPNEETVAALEEGERMLEDTEALRFSTVEDLIPNFVHDAPIRTPKEESITLTLERTGTHSDLSKK